MTNKIRNRNSWALIVFGGAGLLVVSWKILELPVSGVVFEFTDFLALLMSGFAIVIAMVFFFHTTRTSNTFYDNTYRFTQDMSEILGRIEAGFGERLRHLDEGYTSLHDRIQNLRYEKVEADGSGEKTDDGAVAAEESLLAQREKEFKEIIDLFSSQAKVADGERRRFVDELEAKAKELEAVKIELDRLRSHVSGSGVAAGQPPTKLTIMRTYLQNKLFNRVSPHDFLSLDDSDVQDLFVMTIHSPAFLSDMKRQRFHDGNRLTERGMRFVRDVARRSRKSGDADLASFTE